MGNERAAIHHSQSGLFVVQANSDSGIRSYPLNLWCTIVGSIALIFKRKQRKIGIGFSFPLFEGKIYLSTMKFLFRGLFFF